jgi:hypothetical protein
MDVTNMHNPLAREGNFCDENGNLLKPQILQGHNQHMWCTDKGDRMTQQLLSSMLDMEVEKKPFFSTANHDYCEYIPSPDTMWCRKDTQ